MLLSKLYLDLQIFRIDLCSQECVKYDVQSTGACFPQNQGNAEQLPGRYFSLF